MCERNIDRLLLTGPQPGTWPATQVCALIGNQTSNLLVCRLALNPLSHNNRGKEGILITRDENQGGEKSLQTTLAKLTIIFPVTSTQFTAHSPKPFSCHFFTKVLFLCLKDILSFCSGHFFRSSFCFEGSLVHVKILIKLVCFSSVNLF